MNAKQCFVALLSAFVLMACWTKLDGAPLIFFFSGQITERRAQNSVFTEPNTDQFYGYFSYDPAATIIYRGIYPLLSFSIDGNSLNFTNNALVPGIGTPGIVVNNGAFSLDGPSDSIEIRGTYPPAASNPYEYGSTAIWFTDSSGLVFTNNSLPASLSLSSFDIARVGPNVVQIPPSKITYDQGMITQLTLVPEPDSLGLLGLGLLSACYTKRRFTQLRQLLRRGQRF